MAGIRIDGIDGLILDMERRDAGLKKRIDRAMELAGGVLAEEMRSQTKRFKAPTGELASLTKPGKVFHNPSDARISVWPQGDSYVGRRGSPRRAETVGFVVNYGVESRGQKANPWMKRGLEKSVPRVNSIMEEVIGFDA